jgi:hypothetical protein
MQSDAGSLLIIHALDVFTVSNLVTFLKLQIFSNVNHMQSKYKLQHIIILSCQHIPRYSCVNMCICCDCRMRQL